MDDTRIAYEVGFAPSADIRCRSQFMYLDLQTASSQQ